jgi:hypothetical protein
MTNKCILGFGIYTNDVKTKVGYFNKLIRNKDNADKIDDFLSITKKIGPYDGGNDVISLENAIIEEVIDMYKKTGHAKTVNYLDIIEEIQDKAFFCIRVNDDTPNGIEEAELEYQVKNNL